MTHYAIDFGNSNTVIASDRDGGVALVPLPGLTAERGRAPVVPSAVYFPGDGGAPLIGKEALRHNFDGCHPGFAQGFKRPLARGESHCPVARSPHGAISARQAAEAFFDGLRRALPAPGPPRRRLPLGWWDAWQAARRPLLADLTLTAPVEAVDRYRQELLALAQRNGARTVRLLDEPVAAALGYGVNIERELTILVCDWGGGTLDVCVVRTGPRALDEGRAEVLAKGDAPLGGRDVDEWIVARFVADAARHEWDNDARWEAERVKESASLGETAQFRFRDAPPHAFARDDLIALLQERGAYRALERALETTLHDLARHGLSARNIDEALLVGGSSLLPGVDARLRCALPGVRVGEWNLFGAVALGACEFARGGAITDQIYHDYSLLLGDAQGQAVYHELIVPAGTRYPTTPMFAERVYTPDPGRPDQLTFEICEILRMGHAPVPWRAAAGRHTWRPESEADRARVRAINEGQSVLHLPPARRAEGRNRKMCVTYRVDGDHCLRWTVREATAVLVNDEVLGRLR